MTSGTIPIGVVLITAGKYARGEPMGRQIFSQQEMPRRSSVIVAPGIMIYDPKGFQAAGSQFANNQPVLAIKNAFVKPAQCLRFRAPVISIDYRFAPTLSFGDGIVGILLHFDDRICQRAGLITII